MGSVQTELGRRVIGLMLSPEPFKTTWAFQAGPIVWQAENPIGDPAAPADGGPTEIWMPSSGDGVPETPQVSRPKGIDLVVVLVRVATPTMTACSGNNCKRSGGMQR